MFPAIIKRLTDAGERRAGQLRDLRQKLAALQEEYRTAIAEDDDTAAAKVHAKIEKIEGEIREKETAIAAAGKLASDAQRDAAAEVLAAKRLIHEQDMRELIARAIEFDKLVNDEVAPMWREVDQLFSRARLSAIAADVDFLDVHGSKPHHLWRRVWMRFTQSAGRNFGDVAGARVSTDIESVEDFYRVKN